MKQSTEIKILYLFCPMKSLPKFSEFCKVNRHVTISVRSLDVSNGLGLGHVAPHLGDEALQLLHGDDTVTIRVEQFKCLEIFSK